MPTPPPWLPNKEELERLIAQDDQELFIEWLWKKKHPTGLIWCDGCGRERKATRVWQTTSSYGCPGRGRTDATHREEAATRGTIYYKARLPLIYWLRAQQILMETKGDISHKDLTIQSGGGKLKESSQATYGGRMKQRLCPLLGLPIVDGRTIAIQPEPQAQQRPRVRQRARNLSGLRWHR